MSSATDTAAQRFQQAFKRLKDGKPEVLPHGTPVSQNNVAKEAGTDPSALRKARYPALIREIQAWVELNSQEKALKKQRREQRRRTKTDLETRVKELTAERDDAQSALINAEHAVLELLQEKALLQAQLDDLRPPPTPLRG
ncbi:hypothetical protein [Burkholderia pseudomallei]|uniref:hypothetical protein n=1 Tax=Burkholderia pseudomallei TaxID=28450 RepID=UPI001AD6C17D|nr:hypothetical protein [Burkholderia pseudomallei]MBO7822125.1 hypothetical protein [Burkholderia pseudomallei]